MFVVMFLKITFNAFQVAAPLRILPEGSSAAETSSSLLNRLISSSLELELDRDNVRRNDAGADGLLVCGGGLGCGGGVLCRLESKEFSREMSRGPLLEESE